MTFSFRKILTLALAITFPASALMAQDAGPSLSEIVDAWLKSPHADRASEAFVHWNEDGEIPGTCAVCHSGLGNAEYVAGEMATIGRIDHPVPLGATVDCATCHNSAAAALQSVPLPSGAMVENSGASAICTVCHQGRSWTGSVEAAVEGLEDDTVSAELGFVNVHYAASAATLMGGAGRGGYEYAGKTYKGQFTHVPQLNTCTACHSPHTTEVALEGCTTCHKGAERFTDIRISPVDFDGDGNTAEGIADPIAALHGRLGAAIARYGSELLGAPIIYAEASYPYFFNDTDADGVVSEGEAAFPNRFQSWTPRLLRAAYNYQYVAKDKGAFTHNPHYVLQLLYDSLESLSERVEVDISDLTRP